MERIRNDRGVAMMTVIYVAAVLTVVSSTAAFLTIKEFRAGTDDRRGAEALSYAESGVDRLMLYLRTDNVRWGDLNEAGCSLPPIMIPRGRLGSTQYYDAYLTVFDNSSAPGLTVADRLPDLETWTKQGDTWDANWNNNKTMCTARDGVIADPEVPQYFAISSTGRHPEAKRVVRQIIAIRARGLPIGLYADTVDVQGGNPTALNISLVTPGDVQGREKLGFTGSDPYYKMGHFWDGASMAQAAPAAVHARGTIFCRKQECGNDQVEHPTPLECGANPTGVPWQAQFDQSGGGGPLGGTACAGSTLPLPPYSSFSDADLDRARPRPQLTEQEYSFFKAAAKSSGMYCAMTIANSGTCTTPTGSFSTNGTIQTVPGVPKSYVAYFDFPTSGDPFTKAITWKAAVGPCSDDASVHGFSLIVVRNGSLDLTGKDEIVGAFLAPEGQIWMRGSGGIVKVHGTAIAKKLDFGGNAEVINSPCWVRNMPTNLFMQVTPQAWSEVDR